MSSILLFEKNQEKIPQLIFLLKLADIHCTVARTVEEVLNWINACQMMVVSFDLFLLNSLEETGLDNMLLTELCNLSAVPIVCVKREAFPHSIFVNHKVITCHPDELLDCLERQLAHVNQTTA
jgi:hypothetical protein